MGDLSGSPWPAPAKINLFLHVVGRRSDGYHDLQTAFQFLDLVDWIHVEPRSDGRVEREGGPPGLAAEDDLTVRAARALKSATGATGGVSLRVDKRIPVGGGLGGGSSDAATVLVALDRLWGLDLGPAALARIGLGLGADVPVFVHGAAAWAEGVGERLRPIALDRPWYLVVTPDVEALTPAVFNDPALTRNTPQITMSDFLSRGARSGQARTSGSGALFDAVEGCVDGDTPGPRSGSGEGPATVLSIMRRTHNDCEPVARRLYPAVGRALEWAAPLGPARMTGTGARCRAAGHTGRRPGPGLAELPRGWRGFVVQGVNRSPLVDRAADAAR